ncbi:ribonuclease P protein component [Tistlia consotensis]|uniref:ribonuclease P protein component n=1 Tax=Tistlia consotensis TaxID=1321365 RepID=UPI001F38348F|nr:ribonuclease P protein component [Tistlia consotensis]
MERLKRRGEFLEVAGQGRKWAMPGLVLQALHRPDDGRAPRYGLTASRKVGGAVARNRARRRLRALAERWLPEAGQSGTDYVLIARAGTVTRPFDALEQDLRTALERVVAGRPARPSADRPRGGRREARS